MDGIFITVTTYLDADTARKLDALCTAFNAWQDAEDGAEPWSVEEFVAAVLPGWIQRAARESEEHA